MGFLGRARSATTMLCSNSLLALDLFIFYILFLPPLWHTDVVLHL